MPGLVPGIHGLQRGNLRDGCVNFLRYGRSRLVFAEHYDDIAAAIQRKETIKHWPRAWNVNLVVVRNLDWGDPYKTLP